MTRKIEILENFRVEFSNIISDAESLVGDLVDSKKNPKLSMSIDATHSGRLTNNRVYPGKRVRAAVGSWTSPKSKPVLKNHDASQDPIGRVRAAEFVQLKNGRDFDSDYVNPSKGLGSGLIKLSLDIMDPDAIQKFVDGRFTEFSTRQGFTSFQCSFCGNDLAQSMCGHFPGDVIKVEDEDGETTYKVYGITGPLDYREVSVVNIPGDKFTGINTMELVGADSMGGVEDLPFS